ncbi:MAG: PhzF family phenazine biosynthesis protein [Rheinheimera sp.]|nr:MAG: PhzF family phenazine biosynthesis protein [Rheinheimera sp.]
MQLELYQVDAFTNQLFAGNAAAVVPLPDEMTGWPAEQLMLQIAAENNLSETAFLKKLAPAHYQIRWFSPLCEIDFCGHATLAAAFVLFSRDAVAELRFSTGKVGDLTVQQGKDGWLEMNFPQRPATAQMDVPGALLQALNHQPTEVLRSDQAWFLIYDDAIKVQQLTPDMVLLKTLWPFDVVATAPGRGFADDQYDFVSRYFWPANGGDEDPVTGSIHAGLAPYWAARLDKTELLAYQASSRGGVLRCALQGNRVQVCGQARLYLRGEIEV